MSDKEIFDQAMKSGNAAAISAAARGDMQNAKIASTPGGIEAQERAGQATMVEACMLPIECTGGVVMRDMFADLTGIKYGEKVDSLFTKATLPEGWKLRATEHAMHSELVDDTGAVRASIFYKAAFYDRRADMQLLSRYVLNTKYSEDYKRVTVSIVDKKTGTTLHESGVIDRKDHKTWEEAEQAATKFLNDTYPDNRNPLAYWK